MCGRIKSNNILHIFTTLDKECIPSGKRNTGPDYKAAGARATVYFLGTVAAGRLPLDSRLPYKRYIRIQYPLLTPTIV
jgi:hypothetical protein